MQSQSAHRGFSAARNLFLFLALVFVGLPDSVDAQDKEPAAKSYRDRVCDFAILSDGTRLTGIAVHENPARLVLRTERLKADASDLFTNEIQPALANPPGDLNQKLINALQQRIDRLKIDAPNDLQQIGLLDEVVERLKPDDNQIPPWLIVEIEPKRLKRLEMLPPNRRELATLALLNEIDDFENLHWKTITARLQAIPADQLKRPAATSASTLPEVHAERIFAAVDVRLGKATRLIQTGDQFVSEDAKPDLATLLPALLGNSLNSTLQELLNETGGAADSPSAATDLQDPKLPVAAIRLAEKNGHSSVVVSSFDFNVALGTASVTRQLFRNAKSGDWNLVCTSIASSSTNDVTPAQVQKIEDDPQVKEISGLLSQLSPDPDTFKTALQMGAVVDSALAKSDAEFQATLQDIITARTVTHDTPPTVVLQATVIKSCPVCGDDE